MLRAGLAIVGLGLVGLFGYYFITDSSNRPSSEKAKDAVYQVGDAVRDKGVASLIDVRLKSQFGIEATRFLHVYYDEGRAVIYGLAPESVDAEALRQEAAKVSGVSTAEVFISTRPAHIQPLKGFGGEEPSGPAAAAEGSSP